ncbi:MAG: lytic transglycosylase domain-containing protein [Treponema sp.]|nr:lytic transglycosylase domain-containing protein [Treponema sp.]
MFRHETRAALSLLLFLLVFSSCGTTRVLGLRQQEAADLLRNGDLEFIVRAELPENFSNAVSRLAELARIHPAAPFYAGLLAGAQRDPQEQSRRLEMLLFSAALESPSIPARREAALRLAALILEAGEASDPQRMLEFLAGRNSIERADYLLLRAACLYRLGRFSEAAALVPAEAEGWKKALALFAAQRIGHTGLADSEARRQEIIAFLFDLPAGDLRRWAYTEALSIEGLLDPGDRGIIFSRRFPVSHRVTLNNLQPALLDGGLLFFRHPALIGDLARAYQFTPAMREEGLNLFAAWDSLLESGDLPFSPIGAADSEYGHYALVSFARNLDREAVNARRYLILHHSVRIERARGRLADSSQRFWQALEFAPDTLQSDACFWYILMNAVVHDPSGAAPVFLSTMPQWYTMTTFDGVLDRLSRYLASHRRWSDLLDVFHALENRARDPSRAGVSRAGTAFAQYAWIVGRAVQEGFLEAGRSAENFFRIAFEETSGSVYYRVMAAASLGEKFSSADGGSSRRARRPAAVPVREGGELEFLLGFFEHGAASFALPFVRAREDALSVPELRMVAGAFAGAQNWAESLRLVARYARRPDHQHSREDLYLSHPRPFADLIERYAREMGIAPEIMFGLIRTESFFQAGVSSHAGAVGLAQLMPATAADIAIRMVRAGGTDHRTPEGINLTDPQVNVHLGSFYLRHLIYNQMEGSPMLALKAYNGGQGRVRRWLAEDRAHADGGLPKDLFLETILYPETRNYGRLVLAAAAIYGYLYYGRTMEEVAADIFR